MIRIEHNDAPFPLEVKRFRPPFTVISNCPNCGKEHHGPVDYLSYPRANDPDEQVYFSCECNEHLYDTPEYEYVYTEWSVNILIKITAEIVEDS